MNDVDDTDFHSQLLFLVNPEQCMVDYINFTSGDTYSFGAFLCDMDYEMDGKIELFWMNYEYS